MGLDTDREGNPPRADDGTSESRFHLLTLVRRSLSGVRQGSHFV